MPTHPDLHRFVRKFVLRLVPAAGLATVLAAALFAQHWAAQPARVEVVRSASAGEEIVQMIRDEHALMTESLKQQQERELARQPLSLAEMKAREAVAAPARRAPESAREAKAAPLPPAKPQIEVVAESAPTVAPEPKRPGLFARLAATAGEWTDKAIDLTGLRLIPALIRELPARAELIGGDVTATAGTPLIGASR